MAHDVFISYSINDKSTADVVCATLEANGISCWIAPRNIVGGSYSAAIIRAINECKLMVLVFSSHSNKSPQVQREVERAVSRKKTIYPLRTENVLPSEELELFISSEQWMDAWSEPLEKYLQQYCHNVKQLVESTGTSPSPDQRITVQSSVNNTISKRISTPLLISMIVGTLIGLTLVLLIGKSYWINNSSVTTSSPQPAPTSLSPESSPINSQTSNQNSLSAPMPSKQQPPVNKGATEKSSPSPPTKVDMSQLVSDVFSNSEKARKAGVNALLSKFDSDPKLLPTLLDMARQNPNNSNGIYNTAVILAALDTTTLRANQAIVNEFLDANESADLSTTEIIHDIRRRFARRRARR